MTQYRIKINTLHNGNKEYIPQVFKFNVFGKWRLRMEIVWENICKRYSGSYFVDESMCEIYSTEESALQVIEDYKRQLEIEKSSKVKSTHYKEIK